MTAEMITYEQPLNEIIRVCLRLEHIFQRVDHALKDDTVQGTQQAFQCVIHILHLLERPDLKSKLAKELNCCLTSLMRYGNLPEIDEKKLESFIQQLEELSHHLIESSGKIGHHLRDIELFNLLCLHLGAPGGGLSFDTPLYHYWLAQPLETHRAILHDWLQSFNEIRAAVALLLEIVRNHAKVEEKMATNGFHQELLDPQSNLRMIRVSIQKNIKAFPEMSVGRHFLSTRFFEPDILKRPNQYAGDVPFLLAYCY